MSVARPPPAVDIIPSEEIIQYLHPALLHVDYRDPRLILSIVVTTVVGFSLILFTSLYLCNFIPMFRALRLKHRVFMCLAISRGIFGLSSVILGGYGMFRSTNLDRDVVFGKNATSMVAIYVTVGFFIFELMAVLLSDYVFKTFSKMLIAHHSFALVGYSLIVVQDANYALGCKGLILEMSTPFSCMCFVFLKAGMENSKAWKINQMILVHTFHLRSVVECYFWYITYCNWPYIWAFMPTPVFTLLYINLSLVTFMMTPYWGYKKTQQLFNPVDWNFQESRVSNGLPNGDIKKSA